jgi:hypothetical protein
MSRIYDAMLRAQRQRDETADEESLHDRVRSWLLRGRGRIRRARQVRASLPELRTPEPDEKPRALEEELASLHVAVHALDDRLSAEVVERETKLLEEIRRGMRGLETELSDRFAAAVLEMQRASRRSTALLVGFVAALAGLVVGVLAQL